MLIKKVVSMLLALSITAFLFGCGEEKMTGLLGSGEDYSGEPSIGDIESASVISAMTGAVTALTVNSIDLPTFSNPGEIIASCRDSILNYMLSTDYARFSNSTKLLSEISSEYPDRTVTAAIGTKDYENTLYKLLGYSGNVRHGETKRFTYLSRVKAYTPIAPATASNVVLDIQSAFETEHTYQMTFFALLDDETSPLYSAVFVKKNSEIHLKSLSKSKGEKLPVSLDTSIS